MVNFCHCKYAHRSMSAGNVKLPGDWSAQARLNDMMNARRSYPGLKVMFAVGGAANSEHFGRVAGDANLRSRFVSNVVAVINQHQFDGVDIDWEYPQNENDKRNYVALLQQLRNAIGGKILTVATAVNEETVQKGFDVAGISRIVDWINVMTYDFYGPWSQFEY